MAGGLNLYLYAGNDPVNRADPLGLWWKTALTIVAAIAVAAVVVMTAPISGPLLLIAAGAAAGFTAGALNEGLNQQTFCLHCILLAGLKGAAVGVIASVPFLLLPAAAGYAAYAGAGALSGFIGYAADWAMTPGAAWSWKSAAISTAIGAALGPAGKLVEGRIAARRPVSSAPEQPAVVPRSGPKGVDPGHHNANVMVRDASGKVVAHERFVSGNMTVEEQALGFPRNTLASHTEARAVRTMDLEPGGSMTITGQNPPCPSCKGAMNRAATESGASIKYQWRQDGKTLSWTAKPKGK